MAVIKHIASKNADYGESERYLIFQHNEYTQKPILDDEGHMILRDEYYLDGLNCDSFTFASECQELNSYYHKNKKFNEIKSHHYIISFDPKDREECGLTGERAQQLGLTFAKKNFPGHQVLVCTHTDGHNESGNIHVHIVINSLRKYDVPQEPYMEFDCESKAGYKHHLSTAYLAHLKQDVMDMCQKEGLHQVDLLSPAERKITEKEYWAQRRGQEKLDKLNQKMKEDGITPKETRYQTEKQFLRDAIDDAASTARSLEEFSKILDVKYHIIFKISRNRYSYLHPGRNKYITGKNLGTRYTEDFLLKAFEENTKSHKEQKEEILEQQAPNTSTDLPTVPFSDTSDIPAPFIFIKSDLRLVINLQTYIKAQQSEAYAQKVKLTNLKQMAQTVAYIQEHGYDSLDDFHEALNQASDQTSASRKSLKDTEQQLKDVNEQIHFTGQYLAYKNVYADYRRSHNKDKFYEEHRTELSLYNIALRTLKEKSSGHKLPSMKSLYAEKDRLVELRDRQREDFSNHRDCEWELRTVSMNIDMILGKNREQKQQIEKVKDL
ncbi:MULTISPECIES: relaxase/mobilization nuclease domain-containing protein [Blautia]|uniref:relaxase/mobilization nuclease domain-containing protein n=1 Tax=Blautia TaxID=572511 RepID=UPI000E4C52EE|nr:MULTISPECIES: relaxase/mobilization nuclease domain-containing protein [Blautia]RHQ36792.1 rlx protein [Ruminococcus sp. AF25-28AC]MCB5688238.1 relaxase/mobilization nuclease domain-containing protein [Blautia wexlerae]NSD00725.1 relaxase/mobilization nuclease domain-containing protein [Blautia wexlerae]NSE92128.1 relaxase/mobilization nuclease domain-containing protein [Blautia wexlerae]NSF13634.1 relaxase/mobilization nuclease domain-containing protein [Blautia wexlerae]